MNEIVVTSKDSLKNGKLEFHADGFDLCAYHAKDREETLSFEKGSIYLFIQSGHVNFEQKTSSFKLGEGFYFSKAAPFKITISPETFIVVIKTPEKHHALETIGGPIEDKGRLNYIDGCSDTLILPPVTLGEPCLNLLHFPKQTRQTMHNHPSFRFGVITSGSGLSISRESELTLKKDDIFFIPAFVDHKFDTHESIMNVIAFHPDSDWGPTDEIHPMINRTWVNGKKI